MRPAHVVEIITPKKFILNGLWFGPKKPRRAIVWVHGLTSSAFSRLGLVEHIVDKETAVLTFNNRGHDSVSRISRTDGKKSYRAGAAYERFEDCIDDINGVIDFAKKTKAKEIYLAGHSTGSQKTAFWASKKGSGVKGIILLAPGSDYAGALMKYGAPKIQRLTAIAKSLIKSGKSDELLASSLWEGEPDSPRRFLSLYTPYSNEQSLFTYFDEKRPAKMLRKITLPMLVIMGENDEHIDRPAREIMEWFEKNTKAPLLSLVAKRATHSFKGHEKAIAKAIKLWIVKK
jgi:alpha-beta hydrolase superfamily lysophospholipase